MAIHSTNYSTVYHKNPSQLHKIAIKIKGQWKNHSLCMIWQQQRSAAKNSGLINIKIWEQIVDIRNMRQLPESYNKAMNNDWNISKKLYRLHLMCHVFCCIIRMWTKSLRRFCRTFWHCEKSGGDKTHIFEPSDYKSHADSMHSRQYTHTWGRHINNYYWC